MKRLVLSLAACAALNGFVSAAETAAWKPWMRIPGIARPVVAESGDRVYFIAGVPLDGVPSRAVRVLNPAARTWTDAAPIPRNTVFPASAVLDGVIYVAGGCGNSDCGHPIADLQAYDPKTGKWSILPSLPEPVWGAPGATLDGKIYVFGGMSGGLTGNRISSRVYAYDPQSRTWTRKNDMSGARLHAAGVAVDGRFLMTGGCASTELNRYCDAVDLTTAFYDPAADEWSDGPAMPSPLYGHGAIMAGSRVILLGGYTAQKGARDPNFYGPTFLLDKGSTAWRRGPSMIRQRYTPSLFRVGAGLAVFGSAIDNNPEDLIETLGVPGPYIDAGEEPRATPPAPPAPRVITRRVAKTPEIVYGRPIPRAEPVVVDDLPIAVAPNPHAHAVVIGVERYREALPRADFAATDARVVAEYFKRVYGVPEENLALLVDDRATKSDFEKYFERWLPNRVEAGDQVYVYYSGHGAPNPKNGASFLVPFDADPVYIDQTGYSVSRLYAQLAKLKAKSVLVALDSCFSGAGGRSVIAKGARPLVSVRASEVPKPLIVMTASSADEISNTYEAKRHGLFTYFLLRGLKETEGDPRATYDYLKPQVSRVARRELNSDQVPQWREGK